MISKIKLSGDIKVMCLVVMSLCLLFVPFANVLNAEAPSVDTSNAGPTVKVAPGELLPISVKLSNFGGGKRVDVLLTYSVLTETGEIIYENKETVAVETTANFVKTIQIPFNTAPGVYTAKTSIVYQGQLVPATTQFSFTVETKILGLFQDDFIVYGSVSLLLSILIVVIGLNFAKRRNISRLAPIDYSDIPKDNRVFYELISDTIMGMRQRVGDRALEIASGIGGLVIDKTTGRVLDLEERPSKVVADLVSGYEQVLGEKVSFSFRREKNY